MARVFYKDYKQAVKWYTKAAEQGDASAQYEPSVKVLTMAREYLQDYKQAVKWYTKAAEQGYVKAQFYSWV